MHEMISILELSIIMIIGSAYQRPDIRGATTVANSYCVLARWQSLCRGVIHITSFKPHGEGEFFFFF